MERWIDIKGHDGYEISNLGHVRNKKDRTNTQTASEQWT